VLDDNYHRNSEITEEKMNIDLDLEVKLYKKMYLIRACEEAIIKEYPNNQMKTPMHMSMGSEHIASAICLALGDKAQIFCSYRSHAPFLARTEDTDQFFLEMYGKKESVVGGKGGSMHLCYPDKGFIMSSAIVGSQISVACGWAWANKQKNNDKIVVVFFGDGATEEGVFWESLNIACLYELPIVFVYENNGLAVHTSEKDRKGHKYFIEAVKNFNCRVEDNFGFDAETIHRVIENYADCNLQIPLFLEIKYFRMLEHVGINEDYDAGYRIKPDNNIDPIKYQRQKLVNKLGRDYVHNEIDNKIDIMIQKSIHLAKSS